MLKAGVRGGWPRSTVGSSRLRQNPENPPLCCPTAFKASIFSNQLLISEGEAVGDTKVVSDEQWEAADYTELLPCTWAGRTGFQVTPIVEDCLSVQGAWKGGKRGFSSLSTWSISLGAMTHDSFFSCQNPGESRYSSELWSQLKLLSTTWWQTPFSGLWEDYGVMLVSVRWAFFFQWVGHLWMDKRV